jgi:hypothetical protein
MFLIVLPTQTVLLDHPVQEKTHILIIIVITLIYTPASTQSYNKYISAIVVGCDISHLYAVHDCFKHTGGQDIFLLDWRQVLSYDVSLLNIRLVVNSVIDSL